MKSPCIDTKLSPGPRLGAACTVSSKYLFMVGGTASILPDISLQYLNDNIHTTKYIPFKLDIHCLDLEFARWLLVEPLEPRIVPQARIQHSIVCINKSLYLYGGIGFSSKLQQFEILNDLWQFDLVHTKWSFISNIELDVPRYSCELHVVHDAKCITQHSQQSHLHNALVISGGVASNDISSTIFHSVAVFDLVSHQLLDSSHLKYRASQNINNSSFVATFASRKRSTLKDSICIFSKTDSSVTLEVWSHNKPKSLDITSQGLLKELDGLSDIKGFVMADHNLLVIGKDTSRLCGHIKTIVVNVPSSIFAVLESNCSHHRRGVHDFCYGMICKEHDKLLLLERDLSKVVLVNLSIANLLKFHDHKTHDADFNLIRETFISKIVTEDPSIDSAILQKVLSKDYDESTDSNTEDSDGEYVEDEIADEIEVNAAKMRKPKLDADFNNYVKYLVADSKFNLTSTSSLYFNNSAIALGRNVFQRYLGSKNNSLSDFQFVSSEEQFVPVPLAILSSRWGGYFNSLLAQGYIRNIDIISKKLDYACGRANLSLFEQKMFASHLMNSIINVKKTNDTDSIKTLYDDTAREAELMKHFRSPVSVAMICKELALKSKIAKAKLSHPSTTTRSSTTARRSTALTNKRGITSNNPSESTSNTLDFMKVATMNSSRKNSIASTASSYSNDSGSLISSRYSASKQMLSSDALFSSLRNVSTGTNLEVVDRRVSVVSPMSYSFKNGSLEPKEMPNFAPPECPISKQDFKENQEPIVFKYKDAIQYKDETQEESSFASDVCFKETNLLAESLKEAMESTQALSRRHNTVEPLLIPRCLYLPYKTSVLRALVEFFMTGQVNGKTTIEPGVIDLYSISDQYKIPLLHNLTSEVLYAVLAREEKFILGYIQFLDLELDSISDETAKNMKQQLDDKLIFFTEISQIKSYNGEEYLQKVSDIRFEDRIKVVKAFNSNDEYFEDDLDDLDDDDITDVDNILHNSHQPKQLTIDDLSNASYNPSSGLIKEIYIASSLGLDKALSLKSWFLLKTIKELNSIKEPIEAYVQQSMSLRARVEEKHTEEEKIKAQKLKREEEMKNQERRKIEKQRLQELEQIQVEKERVKEEQRLRKQKLKKLLKEQQRRLQQIAEYNQLRPSASLEEELSKHVLNSNKSNNSSRSSLISDKSLDAISLTSKEAVERMEKCAGSFASANSASSSMTDVKQVPVKSKSRSLKNMKSLANFTDFRIASDGSHDSNDGSKASTKSNETIYYNKKHHFYPFASLKHAETTSPLDSAEEIKLTRPMTFDGVRNVDRSHEHGSNLQGPFHIHNLHHNSNHHHNNHHYHQHHHQHHHPHLPKSLHFIGPEQKHSNNEEFPSVNRENSVSGESPNLSDTSSMVSGSTKSTVQSTLRYDNVHQLDGLS